MEEEKYRALRERMVDDRLALAGITDKRVLEAMRRVPRHRFVTPGHLADAYANYALPISSGQTISQPIIVAQMLQAARLTGSENVLEVGTGSGYQAALLAELARRVTTLERLPKLAEGATSVLQSLGYGSVEVIVGDGSLGCAPSAPYDRILVAAAAPKVPVPLLDQLAPNGILVIPVGSRKEQSMLVLTKDAEGRVFQRNDGLCVFVPLIGEQGWSNPEMSDSEI